MVKLYRICLQKNEENPVKGKENCEIYIDAIREPRTEHSAARQPPSHRRDQSFAATEAMGHDASFVVLLLLTGVVPWIFNSTILVLQSPTCLDGTSAFSGPELS